MTITEPVTRPARRAARTTLTWLLLVPGTVWAMVRLGGWERGYLVQLIAFTPYALVWSLIPAMVALLGRRWLAAAVGAVAATLLAVSVLPRAVPDQDPGPRDGVQLPVMTANLLFGGADPARIVALVREHGVAVLALQEFTGPARDGLAAAGLGALLPYSSLAPEPGASGSAIYARFPLTGAGAHRTPGGFQQAYAVLNAPGATPVAVESAHPLAPCCQDALAGWRTDLGVQPRPDPAGPPRILLGDFNATLDHEPMRALLADGYRDAGDVDGAGLVGTWGPYDGDPIPPVTIDHVLVDKRIGVGDVSVHRLGRSDHRSVLASLTVPRT